MAEFSARQQQIIEESIRLISERGIQELTIKNISEQIGITEPALYRHFKNKMDIILSILEHFEQNTKKFFDRLVPQPDESAIDSVETIFLMRIQGFANNPALASVIFSEELFRNYPALTDKVRQIMNLHQSKLQELLQHAQMTGQFDITIPPDHIGIIILGALRLLVTRWRLSKYSFDLMQEGTQLWKSIKTLLRQNNVSDRGETQ